LADKFCVRQGVNQQPHTGLIYHVIVLTLLWLSCCYLRKMTVRTIFFNLCEYRTDQNGETPAASVEKKDESRPAAEVRQIDIGKEAAMEAEVKAARERAIIPLEIRMKQFRDMLSEKEASLTALIVLC